MALGEASSVDPRKRLGDAGEELALNLYHELGYNLVERNFRCRMGEIDLILESLQERMLVFAEVRSLSSESGGIEPQETVDIRKRGKLCRTAKFFLGKGEYQDYLCRFDVVSVLGRGKQVKIEIFENAFY